MTMRFNFLKLLDRTLL